MRRNILTLILSLPLFATAWAQDNLVCGLGFAYEISNNRGWGFGEPVIIDITPNSPAERAGLQLNDIILSINGKPTYLQDSHAIHTWFLERGTSVELVVRNIHNLHREMVVNFNCRHANAICESQLAPVFAFYSLEDMQNRRFVLPLESIVNGQARFYNYRTFAFAALGDDYDMILNARINAIFTRVLTDMGLTYNANDPDFIIRTFFSYQPNQHFDPHSPTLDTYQLAWRYDLRTNSWMRLPIFCPTETVRLSDIPFHLEFGYQFFDRRHFGPGESPLIWEGFVRERLSGHFPLVDYLEIHLPLMLRKFPNPGNRSFATFHLRASKHNYTGISFDMNDLRTVVFVSPTSPAARAGILPGDVIHSIEGRRFNHRNAQQLTTAYHRFIAETMNLRDPATRFTDAHGFANAMYWDPARYPQVARAINNHSRYRAVFAYLFNFNPYIDPETPRTLQIVVQRGRERLSFEVVPMVVSSSHLFAF